MKNILTKLIILNLTMLWGISYDFPITVTDGEYDRVLTVGVDSGASNGYDVDYDLMAPPLPPSDDVFDTRIVNDLIKGFIARLHHISAAIIYCPLPLKFPRAINAQKMCF